MPLLDAFSLSNNPLLLKAVRSESRKHRPMFALLGTVAAFLIVYGVASVIWRALPISFTSKILMREWSPLRIAWIAIAGIHAYILLIVVVPRTHRFFQREATQNTLEQLLITPMDPAEFLLHVTVHPFIYGMLVALLGLPIYALWLSTGDLTVWQLLAIYILLARMAFLVPSPQGFVVLWRMRSMGKPATVQDRSLKRRRTMAAVVGGLISVFFQLGIQLFVRVLGPRLINPLIALWSTVWPTLPGTLQGMAYIFPFSWFLTWFYFGATILSSPFTWYRFLIPPLIFAVPLMIAGRWLAILRGAVFIRGNIPLMTSPAGSTSWPVATIVRSDDSLQIQMTRLKTWGNFCLVLIVLGYLWKPLITSSSLSSLLKGATDSSHAFAALLLIMSLLGLFGSIHLWREEISTGILSQTNPTEAVKADKVALDPITRWIQLPLVSSLLILIIACVLAGFSPISNPVLILIARFCPLGIAASMFCLSARWWQARSLAANPPPSDDPGAAIPWIYVHPRGHVFQSMALWYFSGAWRVSWCLWLLVWVFPFIALLVGAAGFPSVSNILRHLSAVSPLVSLVSISGRTNEVLTALGVGLSALPPWWMGLVMQPLAAIAFMLLGLRIRIRSTSDRPAGQLAWWEQWYERLSNWNDRFVARLINTIHTRIDNPVAVKDARARGRRENWALQDLLLVGGFSIVVALSLISYLWFGWAEMMAISKFMIQHFGDICSDLHRIPIFAQFLLSPLGLLWILGWSSTPFFGCAAGTAFDGERDGSTLGFLLITPLKSREIFFGKWLGNTIHYWFLFLCLQPASLLIALAAALSGSPQVLILALSMTLFLMSIALLSSSAAVGIGARCKARGSGFLWTLLLMLIVEIASLIVWMRIAFVFRPSILGHALVFLLLATLHVAGGYFFFRRGEHVIEKMRTGDVLFEGQKQEN